MNFDKGDFPRSMTVVHGYTRYGKTWELTSITAEYSKQHRTWIAQLKTNNRRNKKMRRHA